MSSQVYVVYAGTEDAPVMLGVRETRESAEELQNEKAKAMWEDADGTEAWTHITIDPVNYQI